MHKLSTTLTEEHELSKTLIILLLVSWTAHAYSWVCHQFSVYNFFPSCSFKTWFSFAQWFSILGKYTVKYIFHRPLEWFQNTLLLVVFVPLWCKMTDETQSSRKYCMQSSLEILCFFLATLTVWLVDLFDFHHWKLKSTSQNISRPC